MAKTEKPGSDFVKKETMLLIGAICLVVGFIGGVAFSTYKSVSSEPMSPHTHSPQPSPPQMAQQMGPTEPTPVQMQMIQELETKTADNDQDMAAWIQLGNLYFDTHQFEKAITTYEKYLALDPNNADVWTDLGVMYRRSNLPEKAIEAFDRAIAADPRHETAMFNKGIVLMHDFNDMDGTVKVWEKLVEVNPNALAPGGGQSIKEMVERIKATLKQ